MNTTPTPFPSDDAPRDAAAARPWERSEVFCIHSYAGVSGPPCGWHGLLADATLDAGGRWRCPRCGRRTLMRIEGR